eukprot:5451277-Amphidinium_carterae.1
MQRKVAEWRPRDNLQNFTRLHRQGLRWLLSHRHLLYVCDADKNMGVTICSPDWIHGQAHKHLADACVEKKFDDFCDAVDRVVPDVSSSLQALAQEGKVSRNALQYLASSFKHCTVGRFRILPKLHKSPVASRPIFTSGFTTPLAQFLTDRLAVLLDGADTICRSTDDALQEFVAFNNIKSSLHSPTLQLVSFDITSLYPSISIPHCIEVLARAIRAKFQRAEADPLVRLVGAILSLNWVSFKNAYYCIVQGIATGSSAAVVLANAYLLEFDRHVLDESYGVCLYKRFIDD